MRKVSKLLLAMCMLLLGSCSDIATEGAQPLNLELTASATSTSPGQAVELSFSGTGTLLFRFTLDYGDGTEESVDGRWSHSITGTRTHVWDTAGSYRVVGTLEDSSLGATSREVTIQVVGQ